jgi:signal transduction histidine kinase
MSANALLSFLTQALFVLVFLVVVAKAVRQPRRATIDTALLFGVASLLVAEGWAAPLLHLRTNPLLVATSSGLIMALPYLLVRLVDDFAHVPRPVLYGAVVGLGVAVASFFIVPPRADPLWLTLLYVAYFVGLTVYTGVAFVRTALRSRGITRRRMLAVAVGSLCLSLTILAAGFQAALPAQAAWWTALASLSALGSGFGYFVGFAPPSWLRWAWQVPEVRAFLAGTARLPHLPDTRAVILALERGIANALGAPYATISLWDEAAQALGVSVDGHAHTLPLDQTLSGRAFAAQQALLSANLLRDSPALAQLYRAKGIMAALAAPITAGAGSQKRLGVLTVYALRAPLFADDGLELAQLLAHQVAVILESRALIDDLAHRTADLTAANKELDAFSYSVSHDLRSPLRAIDGFARILLEEHAPQLSPDAQRYLHLVRDNAQQLGRLVDDLLAFSRLSRQPLATRQVAPTAAVREALAELRPDQEGRRVDVALDDLPPCQADPALLKQVFVNLLANALKFTAGQDVARIAVGWCEQGGVPVYFVRDNGVGFDMRYAHKLFGVFQRLHRAEDYDGTGVGLATVQRIIHRHGGRIWAEAETDRGATFFFTLKGEPPHD